MKEFDFIQTHLAPLATFKGALGLTDDAATITPKEGSELVITKDAIIEDVHFLKDTPAGLIARKLLRVNLSDIAAMGAVPIHYMLAVALPHNVSESWLEAFAEGLAKDSKEYAISLLGGDTVTHDGPLTLSVTMFGELPQGKAVKRSGAKPGDHIYVSGTIGDAYLGLMLCKEGLSDSEYEDYLVSRYHLPQPRNAVGEALRDVATAMIDISDGLLADLSHICECSDVGAEIDYQNIPLSSEATQTLERYPEYRNSLITGGDDYELLFTVDKDQDMAAFATQCDIPLTYIGTITEGSSVQCLDEDRKPMAFEQLGYTHL